MNIDKKGGIFVLVQVMLFVVYTVPIRTLNFSCSSSFSLLFLVPAVVGLIILFGSILQLRYQLSPFPNPLDRGVLITRGFYKLSRHPIYSGILLSAFSYALYSCSIVKILISICLLVLFYFKSAYEEKLLSKRFVAYQEYKKQVGRFFPRIIR
ncbi:isoprenylcysteine carboxylmethyltransferase family protein [Aquimarina sp. RZ0]|uniref:methyltransferase family protein n=1 Tax=Aquimarina sp. RZ0 TaxID=2607730 RepID=UPI0011F0F5A1|nr:isoprenylcysteine carboxylmethyltransferase family protein [Aquimarina sp. RZ0]KAA1244370.1 isoprenylcysteine carboxylmethyltransferase family protein [Aquimarina sp. RZ0]